MDFFPVMRSSELRVRSSDDLLEPDTGPLVERVTECPPPPITASADGRLPNDEGGSALAPDGSGAGKFCAVGRLILRPSCGSSLGRTRDMDLVLDPPLIDDEPP